jgi:hypothetical protein
MIFLGVKRLENFHGNQGNRGGCDSHPRLFIFSTAKPKANDPDKKKIMIPQASENHKK